MSTRTVRTQDELDQALVEQVAVIYIESDAGVWLQVGGEGRPAWGNSRVTARENSRVTAWGNSRVTAWGNSRVTARENSSVEARENSSVTAWENSSVEAWENSSVEARENSSVTAGSYVAVHLHSAQVTLSGGVVIDLTQLDLNDPATWVDYHGVQSDEEGILVYKAVDSELNAGHHHRITQYGIGETVTAPDWQASRDCGHGLHFSPSPSGARSYYNGDGDPRFLACRVDMSSMIALGDKIKAPSCVVLHEVDLHGDRRC